MALSRPGRPTRSSWAPLRHDSDARAFTRALYRGGRNHIRPTNVLSCASRLQGSSLRHAKMNDSVLNNGIKTLPFRLYMSKLEEDSPNASRTPSQPSQRLNLQERLRGIHELIGDWRKVISYKRTFRTFVAKSLCNRQFSNNQSIGATNIIRPNSLH